MQVHIVRNTGPADEDRADVIGEVWQGSIEEITQSLIAGEPLEVKGKRGKVTTVPARECMSVTPAELGAGE